MQGFNNHRTNLYYIYTTMSDNLEPEGQIQNNSGNKTRHKRRELSYFRDNVALTALTLVVILSSNALVRF